MAEEGGYDACFIGEVSDNFRCVVCCSVLKDPIQLVGCGHRLCKVCYETLKNYNEQRNTELCCPLDRKTIDPNQVQFEDKAAARFILSFQVKCSHYGKGCNWTNDLGSLKNHLEQDCGYVQVQCTYQGCELEMERRILTQHMEGCPWNDIKCLRKKCEVDKVLQNLCKRLDHCERNLQSKLDIIKNVKKQIGESCKQIEESNCVITGLTDKVHTLSAAFISTHECLSTIEMRQVVTCKEMEESKRVITGLTNKVQTSSSALISTGERLRKIAIWQAASNSKSEECSSNIEKNGERLSAQQRTLALALYNNKQKEERCCNIILYIIVASIILGFGIFVVTHQEQWK